MFTEFASFLWLTVVNLLNFLQALIATLPMSNSMKDDLDAFRVRERHMPFSNNITAALRLTKTMKAHIITASLQNGVSESQFLRFLVQQGLERYGIDGMKPL